MDWWGTGLAPVSRGVLCGPQLETSGYGWTQLETAGNGVIGAVCDSWVVSEPAAPAGTAGKKLAREDGSLQLRRCTGRLITYGDWESVSVQLERATNAKVSYCTCISHGIL